MTMMRMAGALVIAGMLTAGGLVRPASAATDAAPVPAPSPVETPGGDPSLPSDVYASSRSRVPLITPDKITTDLGKKLYDQALHDSTSLVGLQGPGGISIYSPQYDDAQRPLNRFLRFSTGLDRKLVEVAILISARETNQPFEWAAHEKAARAAGVSDATIDAIRLRKPTAGLPPDDATIIALGREGIGNHRVTPATFASAQQRFGTEQVIDIVGIMGDYLMTGLVLTTFDQQLPAGTTSDLPMP
jgi:4-carboxymuconolactone decarboxylase